MKKQAYPDGTVLIYKKVDVSAPGDTTDWQKGELVCALRYEERTVGITRYHQNRQDNYRVEKVLRCPRMPSVQTEMFAVPIDGIDYEIGQIQAPVDDNPRAMDIELLREVTDYAS